MEEAKLVLSRAQHIPNLRGGASILFYVNMLRTPHGVMAFISDEDLVGRAFVDDANQRILIVSEQVYGGNLVSEEDARQILEKADILVLTGERIVSIAIQMGFAHPDSVLRIKGVPHVHVYKLSGYF